VNNVSIFNSEWQYTKSGYAGITKYSKNSIGYAQHHGTVLTTFVSQMKPIRLHIMAVRCKYVVYSCVCDYV
jgi:hypothetical protein